jgi:diguanylate cyclase (GGDEF)-like protein
LLVSSVRIRLFAVTAGLALIASLAIGAAYVVTEPERADVEADHVLGDHVSDVMSLLTAAIRRETIEVDELLLTRDPEGIAEYEVGVEEEIRDGERLRQLASAFPDEYPGFVDAAQSVADAMRSWRHSFAEPAIAAVRTGSEADIARAAQAATADQATIDQLLSDLNDRLDVAVGLLRDRELELTQTRGTAVVVGVAFMLIAALASVVLVRRWVTVPLGRLVETAVAVESGNEVAFEAHRDDEIGRLGLALERMRLALHSDADRSDILNRFTEVTTFAADDSAVARSNLEALRLLVNPDAAVTHVLNRSKDRAVPEATLGAAVGEVLPLNALSSCPGIVRGSVYVTPNVAAPLSVRCPVYPAERGTVACVPLAHGENVGAVHLAWDRIDAFPLELRASVARTAEHAALAIANRRLLAALQGMASTDARTGLANTRAFDQSLENELGARAADETVAVLMLDLDEFKDFNDRHGHPAGDEALRAFADILRSCLRDGDVAARYGGEEFAVVLPTVDEAAALMVAERIRSRTESALIALGPGITDRITVSIGLATAPAQGNDRLTLLRLADEALYRAKQAGRNRVEYLPDATVPARAPVRRRPVAAARPRRRAS